uniref:Serine-threonine/tyrosine-protein kinase catalytic domain-containing protein n=1 Tax=Biomphalaria glabrata TaxID=6526 RepID=A0A2C9KMZ2_BIOGL
MITNKLPYEGCSVYQVLEQVRTNKRPLIPDHCPPDLCRLIQKCWDQNPAARPGFKEILKALEQLSVSQIWKAPDLPLNAFQNDELDPKKEVPFNNLSLSEPELKVTKVFEPSEIISQIEDKTRLELKSISSESDSESFVLVENNLGHSIPMDIPQLSGQFTSTENSTLQELAQAHITSTSPTVTLSPVLNLCLVLHKTFLLPKQFTQMCTTQSRKGIMFQIILFKKLHRRVFNCQVKS